MALVLAILAAPAQAFHIPGAIYTGTHSGPTAPPPPPEIILPPPSVELTVSPDGLSVTHLRITNVGGSSCGIVFSETSRPVPIVNHSFGSSGSDTWTGTFNAPHSVTGTFRSSTGCVTGTVSWTATTTASAAGTEECKAAQAAVTSARASVSAAQKAVAKARRKLQKAKDKEARAKARRRLNQAQRKLKTSRAKLQAAQAQATPVCT